MLKPQTKNCHLISPKEFCSYASIELFYSIELSRSG